jgi:glutamate--cysteine ligase
VSQDRRSAPELERPIGSVAELAAWLRAGEKAPERFRVGAEYEKIGLQADSLEPVPYEGPRGIGRVLERIAELDGWSPVEERGALVALEKNGASITIEPGGQLELSGFPLRTLSEVSAEFEDHLDVLRRASEPLGLVWLGLGYSPLVPLGDAPRMPKERYRIMRQYLPTRGKLALHMMHLTATVQANVDFSDEADMVAKMRAATAVTPIVSAIFANSPLAEGRPSGFVSRRLDIWRDTDPDRCGLLHFVFDPDFGYERYVEWTLDVPMFFVVRDGTYFPTPGVTFREFLREGWRGQRARLRDFATHLTTLFPEVRLKRVIELRGADAQPARLSCAVPALWKGLLYDPQAADAALALVADWGSTEREEALRQAARAGLAGRVGGRALLDLARQLVSIAAEGLERLDAAAGDDGERRFLDPLRAQLELGKSPGEVVLERWEGEWGRSLPRLIEYARY